jgi:hypothetical protein
MGTSTGTIQAAYSNAQGNGTTKAMLITVGAVAVIAFFALKK